jgi:ubiquinone/menaquinone biosynthesis C-methylase UbiE
MIDYDREASTYDSTRGGDERASAVAVAVSRLLPASGSLLDVACGTGIVTARLAASGRPVLGIDRSWGMLSVAAARLTGRVLRADATRLPVASDAFDAVLMIWLLHLLPDPLPALSEAARIAGPAGLVITTVDKSAAMFAQPSDVAEVTARWRQAHSPPAADRYSLVASALREHGLRPAGESTFPGLGQGRSPAQWRTAVRAGRVPWAATDPQAVDQVLARLPSPDAPRPEPIYRLAAFARTAGWLPDDIRRIGSADELEIAVKRADGSPRRGLPIWVVCVGDQVYVRTWYRRNTGWFAHVLDSRRAVVRVPGVETDVLVEEVGAGSAELRAEIDAAYHSKYGRYGTSGVGPMVADAAAATTLRLSPRR